MTQMLVVGHGNFGTGLLSASKLIIGEQPFITAVDFTEGMTIEELTEKVSKVLQSFPKGEEVYCFTDLAGGTPFNVCGSFLKEGYPLQLFAGSNLPMLVETAVKITYNMILTPEDTRAIGIENIQTDLMKKRKIEVTEVTIEGI